MAGLPSRSSLSWIWGATFLLLDYHSASAELVTFQFEGTIHEVTTYQHITLDQLPELTGPFRGSYTFDSEAVETSDPPETGVYRHFDPAGVLDFRLRDFVWEETSVTILVANDWTAPGDDAYFVGASRLSLQSRPDPFPEEAGIWIFHWNLDTTRDLLDSVELPLVPPVVDDWEENELTIYVESIYELNPIPLFVLSGRVDSLRLGPPVPEPSTWVLVALSGPLVIAAWRRRSG